LKDRFLAEIVEENMDLSIIEEILER